MTDKLDAGDKLAAGIGYKKSLGAGTFSSLDLHVSITTTKREGESDEDFSMRTWAAAEAEMVKQVESSPELLEVIRPVEGSPDDWS